MPMIRWVDLTLIIIQFTWSTIIWLSGERIYFLISFLFLWSLFLLLTWMKMYGVRVCVFGFLLMGYISSPHFSLLPTIPARLNGRPLDWLSDEMMTLLWEAIPKWEISDEDYTPLSLPRHPPAIHCQLRRWWLICLRWITGSTHWFFCVLSKIFIYSCIHRVYPDSTHTSFSKWGLV